jgi:hypothetical protein
VGSVLPEGRDVNNKPTKIIPRTHQAPLTKGTDVALTVAGGALIKSYVTYRTEGDWVNIASTELVFKLDIIFAEC